MSTRFELMIACNLRMDTPQQVLNTLAYMTGSAEDEPDELPPVYLFTEINLWRTMLRPRPAGLHDFPGESFSALRRAYRYNLPETEGSGEVYGYALSFRLETSLDVYLEYMDFLKWLAPYSETEGFVGYLHFQYDIHPILLYFAGGKVHKALVKGPLSQPEVMQALPLDTGGDTWFFREHYAYKGETYLIGAQQRRDGDAWVWSLTACRMKPDGSAVPGTLASRDFTALEEGLAVTKDGIRRVIDGQAESIFAGAVPATKLPLGTSRSCPR